MPPALQSRRRRWSIRLYLLPAAVALCLMLPKLGQGQFNVDTGWYSAIALQAWDAALDDGGWEHLWSLPGYGGAGPDGTPYFNKPPLAFWIHGLSLRLLGPNLPAARLPSVLAALGTVLLTVGAAAALSGRRTALLAGLILALSVEFTRHARAFSLDLWQAMFFALAILIAARAAAAGRGRMLLAIGVPIGLALLTKPLVGLVPLAILALWLVWIGRGRWCGWLAGAAAIAVLIAAPWHVSMAAIHGDAFTGQYFGAEVAARAAGEIDGLNAGAADPLYYLKELLRQYWPWLLTAAPAYAAFGRAALRRERGSAWLSEGMKLAVLWTLAWLVLLSAFADKRPRYMLPVYPMWAWMSAVWLMGSAPRWAMIVRRAMERWAGPVALAAAVVVSVAPVRLERHREAYWDEMLGRVREMGGAEVWEGGRVDGARGARVRLALGRWPRRARDAAGGVVAEPPAGALVMYHEEGGWGPGAGEVIEFRSGPLVLSRVGAGGWRPVARQRE